MRTVSIIFGAAVLALAACNTTTGQREATVIDTLIGKPLDAGGGAIFLFNPDGTVGGELAGEPIIGRYEANAVEVCSTYTSPDRLVGTEFCSTPQIDGDTVVFNRRDGSQSRPFKIGG